MANNVHKLKLISSFLQMWGRKWNISLLDQHNELKKMAEMKKESAMEKQLKEEEKILESVAEKKALMGVAELAKGIQYQEPIKTRLAILGCKN